MNSFVPAQPAHLKKSMLQKFCSVKRCGERKEHGHLFCQRHETMIPFELATQIEAGVQAFIKAAKDNDMGAAMKALEKSLMAERRAKLSIEAQEAANG